MKPRRDLMILVAAVGVSAGGDIGAIAALAVHVQESAHSGLAVAGLFLANWLALAVAAPAGGALVDRADARGLLIAASAFQAVVAAALASTPGLPGVLALSVLLGVGGAIAVPAEFALVGAVAAQGPGAKRANVRVETARNLGYLLGPLAGAGLVALWSVGAALAFDAVTFVAIGLGAALLTVRRPGTALAGVDRPRARDGIGLLTRDPVLRIAIAVLVGSLVAMSMSISADAFFVRQSLHTGPVGLGLLLSSWMVGMVLGSLVAAPRVAGGALAVAALLGTVVQGTGKLGAAAIAVLPVALALYAMGGPVTGQERGSSRADPRPGAGVRPRPRICDLRRAAQLRGVGGARDRRRPRRHDRRARNAGRRWGSDRADRVTGDGEARPVTVAVHRPTRGEPVAVDPKRTAVVLIEYQNDFTSEGGALHDAVKGVMEQTDMLENTRKLVESARAAGATIVHAPITFVSGYGELPAHPYGILKGVVDSTAFVKGEWGAEIVDALAPQEGDVIVEGKRGLDTFATTNLDFILRARGITTIALGGFLTNCCVESTMRSGYEKGYEVITLSDCVAATSPEEHENAIKFDYPMFSEVMTSDAFAGELAGAPVA